MTMQRSDFNQILRDCWTSWCTQQDQLLETNGEWEYFKPSHDLLLLSSRPYTGSNAITSGWKRAGLHPVDRNAEGWKIALNTIGLQSQPSIVYETTELKSNDSEKVIIVRTNILECCREWLRRPLAVLEAKLAETTRPKRRSSASIPVTTLGLDCSAESITDTFPPYPFPANRVPFSHMCLSFSCTAAEAGGE